ncbi:PREDICTED: uncharacterized protein LOC105452625 [Wasmannia auropunctata]|uniref:uncharacterized protein LOC105452625 n=1 Tax=Wasmannia auropunctata TaxID=64793 RepID=UPI0005EF2C0B|nr:PREDICTED: uncharacterized protein LOC105452625 [Wasmannia auropunctata]
MPGIVYGHGKVRFISKTQEAIQHVLFKTTLTMGFTVISGCFPMLYIQSRILIPQFLSMIMAALQRMYITAWAANDLKEIGAHRENLYPALGPAHRHPADPGHGPGCPKGQRIQAVPRPLGATLMAPTASSLGEHPSSAATASATSLPVTELSRSRTLSSAVRPGTETLTPSLPAKTVASEAANLLACSSLPGPGISSTRARYFQYQGPGQGSPVAETLNAQLLEIDSLLGDPEGLRVFVREAQYCDHRGPQELGHHRGLAGPPRPRGRD